MTYTPNYTGLSFAEHREFKFGQNRKIIPDGPETEAHVRNELKRRFRYHKLQGGNIVVQCCFHKDPDSTHDVSFTLSVNLKSHTDNKNRTISPGTYHCWSCGVSGDWNSLAEQAGMAKLYADDNFDMATSVTEQHYETPYEHPEEGWLRDLKPDWDWVRKDSVVTNATLKSVGAKMQRYRKTKTGKIVKDIRLWLPVHEHGEVVAHIGAALSKDQEPKYLNSVGDWAKQHFYGFDEALVLSKKWAERSYRNFCVIVEGPADALVLMQNGIPAMANIGVDTWSPEKATLLAALFDIVFPCGDGDKPGRELNKSIKDSLGKLMDVKALRLEAGTDPASLSKEHMRWVKSVIKKYAKTTEGQK